MLLTGLASAQGYTKGNDTMTNSYQQLYYNNPVGAVLTAYTNIWGNWFYLVLILGPYFMMYIYHGSRLGLASIWLLSTLAAYEYYIDGMAQSAIFYFLIVAWVVSLIARIGTPYIVER